MFVDEQGQTHPDGGFDALVGNPPWDMVRGDSGQGEVRANRRLEARQFTDFVREAGIYRLESRAHVNRYQLFVERAVQLIRPGGRLGLVLPSGAMTDTGAAALRRLLFDRTDLDSVTGVDNRAGVFPIHRSLSFVMVTATAGARTEHVACRFGISRAEALEDAGTMPLQIGRQLVERLSGPDDLGIPEVETERDLHILERIASRLPRLGDPGGWNVRFGRELNATEDKAWFVPFTDDDEGVRPVMEGKQIEPFRASTAACRYGWRGGDSKRVPRRTRLAYRDIASATNRLTLIAAMVPARAVTTHTLFCLKTPLAVEAQHVLCALLNSLVVNYLIRMRVNTHVTVALVSRLPVPLLQERDENFGRLAAFARALSRGLHPAEHMDQYADLQASVAQLYGLTPAEFAHILTTFPLISAEVRHRALKIFESSAADPPMPRSTRDRGVR